MKKRLLMILLVVALLVTAAVFAVQADGETSVGSTVTDSTQCPCGCKKTLGEVAWTDGYVAALYSNTAADGTHFRITTDVTPGGALDFSGKKTFVVYLDGGSLDYSKGTLAFYVHDGATLHVIGNGGTLSGLGRTHATQAGGLFLIGANSKLGFYGDLTVQRTEGSTRYVTNGGLVSCSGELVVDGATLNGCTGAATNTNYCGGAVYLDAAGKLTMKSGTINGANAVKGGAIYSKGAVTISGGTVQGAVASDRGGAIAVEGGSLTVSGSADIIGTPKTGTASKRGGAISFGGTTFNMTGGTVRDGYAENGGNIIQVAGTVNIKGGTITGGEGTSGGNIDVWNGTAFNILDTDGTTIISDGTATNGGNIYVNYDETNKGYGNCVIELTRKTSAISGGTATTKGGSIYSAYSLTINKGTISGGSATYGGAIYINTGNTDIYGGSISAANGATDGGVVYANSGNLHLHGGTITGATVTSKGGAVYAKKTVNINAGGTVSGGTAGAEGGAIYMESGTLSVAGTVSGGTAGTNGGNIYLAGGTKHAITGTATISSGQATGNGGNIYINGTATLNIAEGWDGVASAYISALSGSDAIFGQTIPETSVTATGYTGDLRLEGIANLSPNIFVVDGSLKVSGVSVQTGDKDPVWYPSNADAVEDYEGTNSVIKLYTGEDLDLAGQTVCVDFNGQKDVNVTGEGTLYGIDTATVGDADAVASVIGTVPLAPFAVDPLTGITYVAHEGGFYPIQVKNDGYGLRTIDMGIYFNAVINCNPAIQNCIVGYGIDGTLDDSFSDTNYLSGRVTGQYPTGGAFYGYINGIMGAGVGDDAETGVASICTRLWVKLSKDGAEHTVYGADRAKSFKDVMVAINSNWDSLEDSHTTVLNMYETYYDVMETWDLNKINEAYQAQN